MGDCDSYEFFPFLLNWTYFFIKNERRWMFEFTNNIFV